MVLSQSSNKGSIIRRTKDHRPSPIGCGNTFLQLAGCQKYIYVLSATSDNLWDDEWNTAVRFRLPNLIQGQTYSKSSFSTDWAQFVHPTVADGGFGSSTLSLTITKVQSGYADGTFSGTVFTGTVSSPVYKTITEGVFKNVKVLE